MKKIVRNRIKCKKCGEIIESTSRHDFKFCKCGAVAVDGGKDYLRRVGSKEDYEELVEYEGSDDDEEWESEVCYGWNRETLWTSWAWVWESGIGDTGIAGIWGRVDSKV